MINKKDFLIEKCKDRYNFLKETGYNVLAVMLYGSQNYDLDTADSEKTLYNTMNKIIKENILSSIN